MTTRESGAGFVAGMRGIAGRLRGEFEGSEGLTHRLMKGEAREGILRAALSPYLPQRFETSTGEVVNSKGVRSQQLDLVVVDGNAGAPFLRSGEIALYPVEVVAGAITVRSRLEPGDLTALVDNIASFKRLQPPLTRRHPHVADDGTIEPKAVDHAVFGGIFAFAAGATVPAKMAEAFADECLKHEPWQRPDALLVLDRYCVTWGLEPTRGPVLAPSPTRAEVALIIDAATDSLMFFYLAMMSRLANFVAPPVDLAAYMSGDDVDYKWAAFKPSDVGRPPA